MNLHLRFQYKIDQLSLKFVGNIRAIVHDHSEWLCAVLI